MPSLILRMRRTFNCCTGWEKFPFSVRFTIPYYRNPILFYLPGGYPELYLSGLSSNRSMLQSVRDYAEAGGKLLAECGGMMYLCNRIKSSDGNSFPMVGLLNQSTTMEQMKLRLGYRTLYYNDYVMTGHEFHYSRIEPQKERTSFCRYRLYSQRKPCRYPFIQI